MRQPLLQVDQRHCLRELLSGGPVSAEHLHDLPQQRDHVRQLRRQVHILSGVQQQLFGLHGLSQRQLRLPLHLRRLQRHLHDHLSIFLDSSDHQRVLRQHWQHDMLRLSGGLFQLQHRLREAVLHHSAEHCLQSGLQVHRGDRLYQLSIWLLLGGGHLRGPDHLQVILLLRSGDIFDHLVSFQLQMFGRVLLQRRHQLQFMPHGLSDLQRTCQF